MKKLRLLQLTVSFICLILCYGCDNSSGGDDDPTAQDKVVSINLSSEYNEIDKGEETLVEATVLYSSGKSSKQSVNWSISGPGSIGATFSKSTKVTSSGYGTIEVTAELDGVSSNKTIQVVAPTQLAKYDHLFPSKLDNPRIIFTWLVLLYKKTDIPANTERGHGRIEYAMTQPEIDNIVDIMEGFEDFTAEYTNGEIGYNIAVAVVDEDKPISDFHWDGTRYQWTEADDIEREMDFYIGNETGWFDNIHVMYKIDGSYAPSAQWGGGGYFRDNISRSQYFINGRQSNNDIHVGTWHEAIHGLEVQYWYDKEIPRDTNPDGTGIELHKQESWGYVGNNDDGGSQTKNYFHWMGDLLTGNIRNLNNVGWQNYDTAPNINLGFGEAMYDIGPVRNDYPFEPGGPFKQD